mgnify:CR=1 FL=1
MPKNDEFEVFDNAIISSDPVDENAKHLDKIVDEIYSIENIEVKTDLNQAQINAITKALVFAETYKVGILTTIANKHMALLISKDRKGRGEFTQIAAGMENEHKQSSSLFNKLVGGE